MSSRALLWFLVLVLAVALIGIMITGAHGYDLAGERWVSTVTRGHYLAHDKEVWTRLVLPTQKSCEAVRVEMSRWFYIQLDTDNVGRPIPGECAKIIYESDGD